jgi:O-acetyl-ADP-ribose deacetylase
MVTISEFLTKHFIEETFVDMLFRLMNERNTSKPELYKRANLDRKFFSKLNTNKDYRPSKKNVCALALALQLDNATAKQLIKKAGYILTSAHKFDLVIRYCFENKIYDINQVNLLLYDNGLTTLYISE